MSPVALQVEPADYLDVVLKMIDRIERRTAPSAIERALGVFECFKERDYSTLVQARKAVTDHVFGLIAAGETDEQRLVVAALTYLKSLERAKGK